MEYPPSRPSEPAKLLVRRLWRVVIGLFLGKRILRTKETLEFSNKTSKLYFSATMKWKQQRVNDIPSSWTLLHEENLFTSTPYQIEKQDRAGSWSKGDIKSCNSGKNFCKLPARQPVLKEGKSSF